MADIERDVEIVTKGKKGKHHEIKFPKFDKGTQGFKDGADPLLAEAYAKLDYNRPDRKPGFLERAFDKLTFQRHHGMDGKLDFDEQRNSFARFIGSEIATGSANRQIEMHKAMATVLSRIDYNDSKQVEAAGKMLANRDNWRDGQMIGYTLSKMENPEQVAALLVAMGKNKDQYRGAAVLAYVLQGKNYSQEPGNAKNDPDKVNADQVNANEKFVTDVLDHINAKLSPTEMAAFLSVKDKKPNNGRWAIHNNRVRKGEDPSLKSEPLFAIKAVMEKFSSAPQNQKHRLIVTDSEQ